MAAPFNLEDLAKLKSFVDFVAANPAILNMPQLDFFKKLIEKLGGKVPEGTFQMPAGAKCPFGGDVKSENKSKFDTASSSADDVDEEVPEMEAESEESEIELDMEANNNSLSPPPPLLEPNVLYLEDKPPEIFKKSLRNKPPTQKGVERRRKGKKIKTRKISKQKLKKFHSQQQYIDVKKEHGQTDDDDDEAVEKNENTDPNDPLYTPQIEVKCELGLVEHKLETINTNEILLDIKSSKEYKRETCYDAQKKKAANDYDEEDEKSVELPEEYTVSGAKDDEEYVDKDFNIGYNYNNDDDDDDDDDEPLILLRQLRKVYKKKKKLPRLQSCIQTCKHKCTTKYTKTQRIDIFNYYWHLSKEDRIDFIRQHIRRPVLTRIRNKKRGNNCRYFLKYYNIVDTMNLKSPGQSIDDKSDIINAETVNADDLTKVCRKFFEGTLGISNREIKEAIEGYELKLERIVRPLRDIIKEENEAKMAGKRVEEKVKRPQLFLDPETGNLSDTRPKKKTKRRKPGEPEPERFPRPINCAIRCIYKCHQNFTEEERKQICDIFWSLDFKRRKDFILARLETKDVKTPITPEFRKTNRPTRAYQSRFYLRSSLNSENKRVCKHFMMNTLCINRKFIENALQYADKTTGNYTGVDGRGKHLIHKISAERKQAILDHINSYPVWVPNKKAKIRCLHHSLTFKRMYTEYREKCTRDQIKPVSSYYYCKVFHDEFRLLFLSNKDSKKGRGCLDINPNISHYTGEEPGGCWLDSKGKPLDLHLINPGQSLKSTYFASFNNSSMESTSTCHAKQQSSISAASVATQQFNQPLNFATVAAAQHLMSATAASTIALNPRKVFQTTVDNLYDSRTSSNSSSSLPQLPPPPPNSNSSTTSIFRMI